MNYAKHLKNLLFLLLLMFCFSESIAQIFVDQKAGGNNNGSSWQDAFTDLQDAIDAAEENDEIWVASGTYLPGNSDTTKSSAIHVTKGIKLFGGFAGNESSLRDRNSSQFPTILSGDLNKDDIVNDFESNRTNNVKTIMLVANRSRNVPIIDGFTFRGGHADEQIDYNTASQGGALLLYSPADIKNCSFKENYSGLRGGALYFTDSIGIGKEARFLINLSCEE